VSRRVSRDVPALSAVRQGPLPTPVRALIVVVALYGFLVGVALLESGIAAMGEGFEEGLLAEVSNPMAGLFAGILATVLVQSSSVSTSTIVGLVGAGTLPVGFAVPMIMGANIGTTVTNTLASLGSLRRPDQFRRAFTAATMHDFFNLMAVGVLLPLELITARLMDLESNKGILAFLATRLTSVLRGTEISEPGTSPLRQVVRVPAGWVSDAVTGAIDVGVAAGIVLLVIGLALIFAALAGVTKNMRELVAGSVERAMNRMVGRGGGLVGILVGIAVTVAVQTSTITTSILVPLVAAGVLAVRNAYPITLGANVGTTLTALMASLAVIHPEGLTIALVHTLFNVTAIALLYPVRRVRETPLRIAGWLAGQAVERRSIVAGYIIGMFILIPVLGVVLL
jgi:solute carrier family 34 (sodium-dependent phosphate cotransporter)